MKSFDSKKVISSGWDTFRYSCHPFVPYCGIAYREKFGPRVHDLRHTGITYVLKKYADMARKENPNLIPESVSCHQLRHSRAMHLLQAGVNLVYIRDLLGHTSIVTTEIYARADSKQKREAIEKASENLTPSQTVGEWVDNHDLISWLKKLGNN